MANFDYEKTGAGMPFRFLESWFGLGRWNPPPGLLGVVLNGVALEVNLGTFWEEALATLAATLVQNIATSLGGHTGTEAVLLLASALGWLKGTLHGSLLLKV